MTNKFRSKSLVLIRHSLFDKAMNDSNYQSPPPIRHSSFESFVIPNILSSAYPQTHSATGCPPLLWQPFQYHIQNG